MESRSSHVPRDRVATFVHRKIGQLICFFILFAADVADGEAWDHGNPANGAVVEETNAFVLYLVFAVDLFNDEFRVGVNLQLIASRKDRESESGQESGVFREIVRSSAEILGNSRDARKVDTDASLARIAARAAVDIGFQPALSNFEWMIEVFGIVENSLAGIARDDLIVLADFLKDLRPDADLAKLANIVAGRTDADASAVLPNALVTGNQIGRN